MPTSFLLLHLLLAAAAVLVPWAACRRRPAGARRLLGAGLLVALPVQLLVQREGWRLAACGWADVVFVSELFVPIALWVVTSAALAQERRGPRARTLALGLPLVGAAAAATTLPVLAPDLSALERPRMKDRVVLQSAPSSCAAAAAATLVRALRVDAGATERELAALCLTRPARGTSDLGLFRGLSLACAGRRVRFVAPARADDLRTPCVVFCGLDAGGRVEEPLRSVLRDACGWSEGVTHAVVLLSVGADAVEIGDPRFGRERWPREHFDALWDGRALVVE